MGSSLAFFLHAITPPGFPDAQAQASALSYVDVRDVAAIHSLSLLEEKAGGERIIADAGE